MMTTGIFHLRAFCAMAILCFGLTVITATAANYRWTGGGANTQWSTLDNWEVDDGGWGAATQAPGAGDVVYLGDAAPDAAQTVTLDAEVTIDRLVMEASGEREYTIDTELDGEGEPLYDLTLTAVTFITQAAAATANLVFQTDARGTNTAGSENHVALNSTAGARLVFERLLFSGNRLVTQGSKNAGILAIKGSYASSSGRLNPRGGRVLFNLDNPTAMSGITIWPDQNGLILARKDASLSDLNLFGARDAYIQIFDNQDLAKLTFTDLRNTGNVYLQAPFDGSAGWLVTSFRDIESITLIGKHINLDGEITALELRRNQQAPTRADYSRGIRGVGRLIKSGTGSMADRNTYTGGTFIEFGALTLQQNSIPESSDGPDVDFAGQLGPGLLQIADGAAFDLNGIDQTVARLQGEGTVQLGGAMLTATNGVAPGTNSVGTLSVAGSGELAISGPSLFDFTDSQTHDQVVFTGDADLTLGGTLEVQVPEAYEVVRTRYTIFALDDGAISGTFDAIHTPEGIWAEIDTSSGDVELILSPPGGTTILIR